VAVLAGRPWGEGWDVVIGEAGEQIRGAHRQCQFTEKQAHHRQGDYPALVVGISYGGGQTVSMPGFFLFSEH
jgi:hypothetical protein